MSLQFQGINLQPERGHRGTPRLGASRGRAPSASCLRTLKPEAFRKVLQSTIAHHRRPWSSE